MLPTDPLDLLTYLDITLLQPAQQALQEAEATARRLPPAVSATVVPAAVRVQILQEVLDAIRRYYALPIPTAKGRRGRKTHETQRERRNV
jgi:uncharacterized protein GlcG (DUF336 family)